MATSVKRDPITGLYVYTPAKKEESKKLEWKPVYTTPDKCKRRETDGKNKEHTFVREENDKYIYRCWHCGFEVAHDTGVEEYT